VSQVTVLNGQVAYALSYAYLTRCNYYLWIRGNGRLDCPPRICTFKGHWTVEPSRVASDARHMAYGERVRLWVRFRDWRASQESPLVACQWPRSSSPRHTSRGHLKPRQQNKRSGAQPYIRAHAPLPDTPTASYCVHFLKAGLRPITTCGRATYKLT
jgi:hypothetical protein